MLVFQNRKSLKEFAVGVVNSGEWRVKGGDGEIVWWKIYDVGDKPGVLIGCY